MSTKNNEVVIGLMCDGWEVIMPNGKRYYWEHNDELLGTTQIAEMLKDMGWNVTVEEFY